MNAILDEARTLRDLGVRELILIAQDTTDYGHNLGMKNGLSALLEELVKAVPDVDWIRILYAFPRYVTDQMIETMASHDQIVPYLDMPLQTRPSNDLTTDSSSSQPRLGLPNPGEDACRHVRHGSTHHLHCRVSW